MKLARRTACAAKALRANAGRLAERGMLVALESFPWSALTNTGIAINLLRRAEAPNTGLLIDVWHFYNGGGHPDQLVDLPAAGITGFQLNDVPLVHENGTVRTSGPLKIDSRREALYEADVVEVDIEMVGSTRMSRRGVGRARIRGASTSPGTLKPGSLPQRNASRPSLVC
ncbi:MAG: Xylose isomerase domain protein barrel [Mycobacterium sp.]|nr:Xylose isomerase domain protein barrel [Mycobacterium sp.]